MTNTRDSAEFCGLAYGMWLQLGAAREQGAALQAAWQTMRDEALFTPEDIAAFDAIREKIKAAGLSLLAEGGDSVLGPAQDVPEMFVGWYL